MTKFILILLTFFLSLQVQAQGVCKIVDQDVNTPVPKELEEAKILIRTKDGKIREMRAEEFKVVPRKQQFKVKERVITVPCEPTEIIVEKRVEVEKAEPRNMIMLGAKRGRVGVTKEVQAGTARVYSNKDLVPDLSYMRRRVLDSSFAAGVGVDTEAELRLFVGYEF